MIKRIKIPEHTPAWHEFRYNTGIGGSEIAYVMSEHSEELSNLVWKSALQAHLQHIGEPVQEFIGNVPSEAGHYMEPIIIEKFRYYNLETHDQMEMYDNMRKNKRMNRIIRPKCFVTNSKYPWLFYSPDALGYKTGKGWVFNVEAKNTNSMEADRYPGKVSPAFILQVMQGLMVCEKPMAYVVIQIDGTWTEVVEVERDNEMCEKIEYYSAQYWKRVLECRQIKEDYGISHYYGVDPMMFSARQQEGIMLLQQKEPEFQGTKPEWEFIKEYVKPPVELKEREGSQQEWEKVMAYAGVDDQIKELNKQKNIFKEQLILSLNGHNQVFFGVTEEKKYYSYKPDKNGSCTFRISKKLKEDLV